MRPSLVSLGTAALALVDGATALGLRKADGASPSSPSSPSLNNGVKRAADGVATNFPRAPGSKHVWNFRRNDAQGIELNGVAAASGGIASGAGSPATDPTPAVLPGHVNKLQPSGILPHQAANLIPLVAGPSIPLATGISEPNLSNDGPSPSQVDSKVAVPLSSGISTLASQDKLSPKFSNNSVAPNQANAGVAVPLSSGISAPLASKDALSPKFLNDTAVPDKVASNVAVPLSSGISAPLASKGFLSPKFSNDTVVPNTVDSNVAVPLSSGISAPLASKDSLSFKFLDDTVAPNKAAPNVAVPLSSGTSKPQQLSNHDASNQDASKVPVSLASGVSVPLASGISVSYASDDSQAPKWSNNSASPIAGASSTAKAKGLPQAAHEHSSRPRPQPSDDDTAEVGPSTPAAQEKTVPPASAQDAFHSKSSTRPHHQDDADTSDIGPSLQNGKGQNRMLRPDAGEVPHAPQQQPGVGPEITPAPALGHGGRDDEIMTEKKTRTITITTTSTRTFIITSCPPGDPNCVVGQVSTELVPSITVIAVQDDVAASATPTAAVAGGKHIGDDRDAITSRITKFRTITSCPPSVTTLCTDTKVVTEIVTTTSCPASDKAGAKAGAGARPAKTIPGNHGDDVKMRTTTLTETFTVTDCAPRATDCTVGKVTSEVVTSTYPPGQGAEHSHRLEPGSAGHAPAHGSKPSGSRHPFGDNELDDDDEPRQSYSGHAGDRYPQGSKPSGSQQPFGDDGFDEQPSHSHSGHAGDVPAHGVKPSSSQRLSDDDDEDILSDEPLRGPIGHEPALGSKPSVGQPLKDAPPKASLPQRPSDDALHRPSNDLDHGKGKNKTTTPVDKSPTGIANPVTHSNPPKSGKGGMAPAVSGAAVPQGLSTVVVLLAGALLAAYAL